MAPSWRLERAPKLGQELPSPQEIEAAKTANGGWTRATLAKWGVSWPPPHGWRRELEQLYRLQRHTRMVTKPKPTLQTGSLFESYRPGEDRTKLKVIGETISEI